MLPNQENMEDNQPVSKPQSHTSSIANHRLVCRSIVLVKRDSLPGRSQHVSTNTFRSPELYLNPVWVYLEENNAVSIKKG